MYTQTNHGPSPKHLFRNGLMATCIVALGFAAATNAQAETLLKPLGTYSHWGKLGEALTGGTSTTYDSTSYNCTATKGCTINVEAMADASSVGSSSGGWRIDVLVDGKFVDAGGIQQGTLVNTTYTTGNMRITKPVTMGTHTIEVEIFVNDDATIGGFETDYNFYTP